MLVPRLVLVSMCLLPLAGNAATLVSRDHNLVYQLDCISGLILCTRVAFDHVETSVGGTLNLADWRALRVDSAQAAMVGSAEASSVPLPGDWQRIASRGNQPLRSTTTDALEALPKHLRDELHARWLASDRHRLDTMALEMSRLQNDIDLDDFMQDVAAWFGTSSDGLPDVVLVAAGAARFGSVATRDTDYLYIESTQPDSGRNRLPVVAHEWTHHLFERMPRALGQRVEQAFLAVSSECALPAYWLLDEVVATAISDGIVATRLRSGEADKRFSSVAQSFYADSDVDLLAKAIVDEVERALSKRRTMDRDFVRQYVTTAEQVLGSRCRDLQLRLRTTSVLQHRADYEEAYTVLRDQLGIKTALVDVVANSEGAAGTSLERFASLSGVVLSDAEHVEELTTLAPRPVLRAMAAVASTYDAAILAWPRGEHAEIYFVVGRNPAATAVAAMHFIAKRRQRFQGWWIPPPVVRLVPERNE